MSDPKSSIENFIIEQAIRVRDFISSLLRGGILCVWILVLALVAIYSLGDKLSEMLLNGVNDSMNYEEWMDWDPLHQFYDENGVPIPELITTCPSVHELESILSYGTENNPVPVTAALYQIDPGWEANVIYYKDGGKPGDIYRTCNYENALLIYKRYEALRSAFVKELRAIAGEENVDIKTATINVAALFGDNKSKRELVDLPTTAKSWLKRERAIMKQKQDSLALLSTFMRLSILGAFGAIIFLIRDFTTPQGKSLPISIYIYRPFLGILLAIAVFVVDIMAHSVISTASILQIRPEPLYILALAAGLLSERVYDVIQNKASGAIDEYTEENKNGNNEPTPPS